MNLYEAINNPNLSDAERWDKIEAIIAEFDAMLPPDPEVEESEDEGDFDCPLFYVVNGCWGCPYREQCK